MLVKLRRKFITALMLVATLMVSILLIIIYQSMAANLQAESLHQIQEVEQNIAFRPYSPGVHNDEPRIYYFVLGIDKFGNLTVQQNSGFQLSDPDTLTELYRIASEDPDSSGEIEKYSLRYLRQTDPRSGSYIFADISDELSTLLALRQGLFAIAILALLSFFFISNLLARWMIAPVSLSWELQKQFVADASHELKTPLTVIMTNADLLASPDCDPEQQEKLLNGISAMTVRMRQLVDGMLDLARVDNGVVKSSFSHVNYSELVEQSLLPFEPAYFESGRTLESHIAPGIGLKGSPQHLAQVTDILLDNAMKYSFPGSTVHLSLQKHGRHALLCVDSPGEQLTDEQRKIIFRRFYTADKARTGGSYGLGLSIAYAIVEEHGGSIWAESDNGHNRFYVKLPL